MPDLLTLSTAGLWLVVLVLAFVVLALARQIGVLHERLSPAGTAPGARTSRVGELLPAQQLIDLHGRVHTFGGVRSRGMLVLFVSPSCPICRTLAPASAERARVAGLDMLLASEGADIEVHRRYAAEQGLEAPYVLAPELARAHDVSMLPFALVVDAAGVLRAKARVDHATELQQLLDTSLRGGVRAFEPT